MKYDVKKHGLLNSDKFSFELHSNMLNLHLSESMLGAQKCYAPVQISTLDRKVIDVCGRNHRHWAIQL